MSEYEWSEEDQQYHGEDEKGNEESLDFIFEIYRYTFEFQTTLEMQQKDEVLGYLGSAVYEAAEAALQEYNVTVEDYKADVAVVE